MSSHGSVTHWIDQIKQGDSAAAEAIWHRYFDQLVRLARKRLRGASRRAADEGDVALSALDSFCRAARQGRFPDLADRDGLWRLLLQITARKAVDQMRRDHRQKRGAGRVRGDSAVCGKGPGSQPDGFAQVVGNSPTPEFAAVMAEQYQRLLDVLADSDLVQIALAKMEGYANKEIAIQLDCAERTMERRLRLIRKKWERELAS